MNSNKKSPIILLCFLFIFYGVNSFAQDLAQDKEKTALKESAILDFALTGDDSFVKDKPGLTAKQPTSNSSSGVKPHAVNPNKKAKKDINSKKKQNKDK
ncbi:MAG: hypothetical protein K6L75_12075 [Cellvibrionaceae bacterium]